MIISERIKNRKDDYLLTHYNPSQNLKVKVAQLCPTLRPHGLYSPWNSPGQNTEVGSLSLLQGIFPNLEIEPWSPASFAECLPAELQSKPENIGVGSLSLLQQVFPTQG